MVVCVRSPSHETTILGGQLDQELEVEVGAPKQASKAPEKLLDQEPEVDVRAPKLTSEAREKLLAQEQKLGRRPHHCPGRTPANSAIANSKKMT